MKENTVTETRDPRVDPRPFDRIKKGGVERFVIYVTAIDDVVYEIEGKRRDQQHCDLTSWKRWAKGAEVVDVAGPSRDEPLGEPVVGIPQSFRGQVLRLANHFAHDNVELFGGISTPYEEALQSLLDIGLAYVLRNPDRRSARRDFEEALKKRVKEKEGT